MSGPRDGTPRVITAALEPLSKVERVHLRWHRAIPVALLTGALATTCLLTGHESLALPMALGSCFAGLTDLGLGIGRHWRSMSETALSLAVGATIGGLVSGWGDVALISAALMAFACGYVGRRGPIAATNGILALVLYAIFAGSPVDDLTAITTGVSVLIGGFASMLVVVLLSPIKAIGRRHAAAPRTSRHATGARLSWQNPYLQHGIRLALVFVVATALGMHLGWPHEYWIPMTVAWISRPTRTGSAVKAVERTLGTLIGVAICVTLLGYIGLPDGVALVMLVIGSWVFITFLRANYFIAVVGVTVLVISLLTLEGMDTRSTGHWLALSTIVAGALVTFAALAWPGPSPDSPDAVATSRAR